MDITNKSNKSYDYLSSEVIDLLTGHFLVVVRGVFNYTDCQKLIEFSESIGYKPASLHTDRYGVEHVYTEIRKSLRCVVDDKDFANVLLKRISHVVPMKYKGKDFHKINIRLRFLKYDTGDHFIRHQDGQFVDTDGSMSMITILLYLNDDYTGANTRFFKDGRDETSVEPSLETGMVVLMDQDIYHDVPPLLTGFKYVIRTELMYK